MAKWKRTVALFEVINKDKRFERKAPAAPDKPPAPFSQTMAAQAADLWKRKNADPETLTGPNPFKKREPVLIPRLKAMWQSAAARISTSVGMARQWIISQLGAVCGIAVALAVIGAMLLARHHFARQAPVWVVEQNLRNGPPHPAVLLVPSDKPIAPAGDLSPEMAADVMQAGEKVPESDPIAKPGARIVNMHYVLVQSYFDEKTANEARDFLNQNGIACTIERGVKGWRKDFYQIIGLQGFAHPSGAEYVAYRHRIEELSAKFSKNPRSYKRFQPLAIKW
ncbi:MAG TPA: hypothetical protein VHX86_09090 [Tepidisphaeraceae bacterium]|jgi:hypothetical protein|nr:hypothetical protein [Tepidisphaeraceae bacterium]